MATQDGLEGCAPAPASVMFSFLHSHTVGPVFDCHCVCVKTVFYGCLGILFKMLTLSDCLRRFLRLRLIRGSIVSAINAKAQRKYATLSKETGTSCVKCCMPLHECSWLGVMHLFEDQHRSA
eukprot:4146821-Amphidinium_carterae.1